nr:ABC transporter permease [Comamonas sp. CMM03]
MLPVLRRNLLQAIPTVFGIVVLNFLLLEWVPGNAADVIAAESGGATAESMAQLQRHFGLDLSMAERLSSYLLHLLQLDLGMSQRHNLPVLTLIGERLGNSLLLMGSALLLAAVIGTVLGTLMAVHVGRWQDRLVSIVALLLYSVPTFWIGLMAIVLFSVKLGWLPTSGSHTIGASLTGWAAVQDRFSHLLLPMLTTAGFYIAIFSRLTRAAMLEVSKQDFVRTAHAKGLAPLRVTVHHVLRNALIPVTTLIGVYFGALLGGATVIETVFNWPGMGSLVLDSILARDYPVLLGVLFCSSLLVIAVNVLVDLLHAALDPRIHVR